MSFKKLLDEHFYTNEDGLIVLTEKFHLQRGYCCGNGCLHCPYDHERVNEKLRATLAPPQPYLIEGDKLPCEEP